MFLYVYTIPSCKKCKDLIPKHNKLFKYLSTEGVTYGDLQVAVDLCEITYGFQDNAGTVVPEPDHDVLCKSKDGTKYVSPVYILEWDDNGQKEIVKLPPFDGNIKKYCAVIENILNGDGL